MKEFALFLLVSILFLAGMLIGSLITGHEENLQKAKYQEEIKVLRLDSLLRADSIVSLQLGQKNLVKRITGLLDSISSYDIEVHRAKRRAAEVVVNPYSPTEIDSLLKLRYKYK